MPKGHAEFRITFNKKILKVKKNTKESKIRTDILNVNKATKKLQYFSFD